MHAGVVPARRVAMDTSLLCLKCSGPLPTCKAPVPKLRHRLVMSLISEKPQRARVPLVNVKTFYASFCPFRLKSPCSPNRILVAFSDSRRRHQRSWKKCCKPATRQEFDLLLALRTKKTYSL